MLRLIVPAMALLIASAATAQEAPAPAAAAAPDKKVCHVTPPRTGSNLPGKRVCKTRAEWDQAAVDQARNGGEALERLRDAATSRQN